MIPPTDLQEYLKNPHLAHVDGVIPQLVQFVLNVSALIERLRVAETESTQRLLQNNLMRGRMKKRGDDLSSINATIAWEKDHRQSVRNMIKQLEDAWCTEST